MQSLRAVNRKVVAGFENDFFYSASIKYWQLQYLGRILIKELVWQISDFDESCFTPKAFIYFFSSKYCCHCRSCVFQMHVCKLCFKYVGFKYVGFNFQFCVFNNFMIHLTANRLRYNGGKITVIFFLNFSKTRDKI